MSMSDQFEKQPPQEEVEEIEQARQQRLDPENRPDTAEVDNTNREFDAARGEFTDSPDYDPDEPPEFSDPEDPNNPDSMAGKAKASQSEHDQTVDGSASDTEA